MVWHLHGPPQNLSPSYQSSHKGWRRKEELETPGGTTSGGCKHLVWCHGGRQLIPNSVCGFTCPRERSPPALAKTRSGKGTAVPSPRTPLLISKDNFVLLALFFYTFIHFFFFFPLFFSYLSDLFVYISLLMCLS